MFSTRENRCRRFQANIFNKSKCQNCFKTVDSHKLSEADLYQVKKAVFTFYTLGWHFSRCFNSDSCVSTTEQTCSGGLASLGPRGHWLQQSGPQETGDDTEIIFIRYTPVICHYLNLWSYLSFFIEMAEKIFCVVCARASTLLSGWDGEVILLMCSCYECLRIGWVFLL